MIRTFFSPLGKQRRARAWAASLQRGGDGARAADEVLVGEHVSLRGEFVHARGNHDRGMVFKKNSNPNGVLFRTYADPAPYPQDTRREPDPLKRRVFKTVVWEI